MSRYFKISGPGPSEWVSNPQQQSAARVLAQFDLGSIESRAAARALIDRSGVEPLITRDGDGSLLLHERVFSAEMSHALISQLRASGGSLLGQISSKEYPSEDDHQSGED
jgi:hypothetical protein